MPRNRDSSDGPEISMGEGGMVDEKVVPIGFSSDMGARMYGRDKAATAAMKTPFS